jgi:hypothetical protein
MWAYIYKVQSGYLRTLTKIKVKGIYLYKQAINVEDSSKTIIIPPSAPLSKIKTDPS